MGNNAYIVNSRAPVDLTIGIGTLSQGQYCLLHKCKMVNQCQVDNMGWWQKGKVIICLARLSIGYACRIGNGLSIGHRVVVFIWLSNWTRPLGVARPIPFPAPRKNWFPVCLDCV